MHVQQPSWYVQSFSYQVPWRRRRHARGGVAKLELKHEGGRACDGRVGPVLRRRACHRDYDTRNRRGQPVRTSGRQPTEMRRTQERGRRGGVAAASRTTGRPRPRRQCMRQEGSAEARYVHLYLFLYAGATNTSQPEEVESMHRLG